MTTAIVVSIQAVGEESDPERGHLSTGLLGDANTVVVPSPSAALLDPGRAFEALILPVPLDAERPIERIRPARVDAMRNEDSGQLAAVVIGLAAPSSHPAMMNPFDGCLLRDEMRTHDDLWLALERVGAIEPGLRDGPSPAVLRAVPAIEREQRRRRIQVHPHHIPDRLVLDFCLILPFCGDCPADG